MIRQYNNCNINATDVSIEPGGAHSSEATDPTSTSEAQVTQVWHIERLTDLPFFWYCCTLIHGAAY